MMLERGIRVAPSTIFSLGPALCAVALVACLQCAAPHARTQRRNDKLRGDNHDCACHNADARYLHARTAGSIVRGRRGQCELQHQEPEHPCTVLRRLWRRGYHQCHRSFRSVARPLCRQAQRAQRDIDIEAGCNAGIIDGNGSRSAGRRQRARAVRPSECTGPRGADARDEGPRAGHGLQPGPSAGSFKRAKPGHRVGRSPAGYR